ncbi:hypothetical protein [Streptomyces sp. NPDC005017]|uniref:hypothetical protein n=1 Tax=Streptomyces sp. NPDC005017 TaxID=3364706 RepID=UPI00368A6083
MTQPKPGAVPSAPPSLPAPLRAVTAPAPDADFAALLETAMETVREYAADWTDHNPSDPGITLLESVVWSMADLHYRTENRPLSGWSAETGLFRDAAELHWSRAPLPRDPDGLKALGDLLAGLTPADRQAVRAAPTGQAAADQLSRPTAPGGDPADEAALRAAAVRLLRAPLVRQAALDATAPATEPPPGARALLFAEEQAAIGERHRRASAAERLRALEGRVRELVSAAADRVAAQTVLAAELDLDARAAADAVGIHPAPPGARPEDWERADGATTCWPPHPLQARTVEPVTTDDYARLAVGVTHDVTGAADGSGIVTVERAWAVPGVLPGIGFDGRDTQDEADHGGAARPGAITLLVQPDRPAALTTGDARRRFLHTVLAETLSGPDETAEVDQPYENPHLDLDRLAPRRLIGDEVGAALLGTCPIALRGVVYVPVTASRQRVLRDALARIGALLKAGRKESADITAEPGHPRHTDGPWPRTGRPAATAAGGWRPGEPVRLAELVQVISGDPEVLGVEDLAAAVLPDGRPEWHSGELPLPRHCVPVLAPDDRHCLTVRLELREGCADGC